MLSNIKIGLIIAIITILSIGGITYWNRGKEVVKLKDEVVVQKVANKVLDKTIKDNVIVAVVTSKVNKELATATDVLTKNRIRVVYKTQMQLNNLSKLHGLDTTLRTKEWNDTEDRKSSEILIDGLWEQFCFNETKYPTCVK